MMKKMFRSVVLAGMLFAAVSAFGGPTAISTVQSFLIAARAGSVEGVKRCLEEGHKLGNGDAEGILAMRIMFQNARITGAENAGRNRCVVYVRIVNPLTGEAESYPMMVKRIDGDWKIGNM